MKMRCIVAPPGCIIVRGKEFGRVLTAGDVVDFNAAVPGQSQTWAEVLTGHESAFETVTEDEE